MKSLCGYFRDQDILLRKSSVPESVSKSLLSKFQEILGKPDGDDEIILRHQQIINRVRSGHPPDTIQRRQIYPTRSGLVANRQAGHSTNIVYFFQPFHGVPQALKFALIKVIDQPLVRWCVE